MGVFRPRSIDGAHCLRLFYVVPAAVAVFQDIKEREKTRSLATGVILGSKAVGGPCYGLTKGGPMVEGLPRCSSDLPRSSEMGAP